MCITIINLTISWFEIVELLISQLPKLQIPMGEKGERGKSTHIQSKQHYFDKSSATVGSIISRIWLRCFPHSQYVIYNDGNEFKLHFKRLCDSYGLKHKPTSVKNPQANAILKPVHQTIMAILCTSDVDTANTVNLADFLFNAALTVGSTYYTVQKPHQVQQ